MTTTMAAHKATTASPTLPFHPTTLSSDRKPLSIDETPIKSPQNPLLHAILFWITECVWPGLGLFGESYLLFSIGTLTPFWENLFPECFLGESCSPRLSKSLTLVVVLGVICGMMLLGTLANTLGRRMGSIITASLMAFGAWGMTLVSLILVNDASALFQCMVALLFVFGVGVGGEYPLSASSASERAMAELQANRLEEGEQNRTQAVMESGCAADESLLDNGPKQQQRQHRGRRVQLVFTMQGMGIFFNCVVMTLLLLIMGQNGEQGNLEATTSVVGWYDASALLGIWRITYSIGAAVLSYVLVSRIVYLQESQVWKDDQQQRQEQKLLPTINEYEAPQVGIVDSSNDDYANVKRDDSALTDVSSLSVPSVAPPDDATSIPESPSTTSEEDLKSSELSLLFRNYGWRLFGASASWFLWDIAFYGNKLFQASFLLALTGDETTLIEMSTAATINALVALVGYFCAAALVDVLGRVQLQQYGFILTGSLFVGCGLFYDKLPTNVLVWMYFGSSFFGQCGPNATTFIIPAEIFPTEMRTMCHGIAAASGKAGALLAAILFSHVQTTTNLFLWSGYASFTAAVVTFCTIPDTTNLNLYETDRRWRMILDGRKGEYVGEATMPKYLSFYERQKMGLNH